MLIDQSINQSFVMPKATLKHTKYT